MRGFWILGLRARYMSLVLLGVMSPQVVRASLSEPILRDPVAQAMGNAVTATVDDDLALFYNPAGLAGVRRLKFRFLNATIEASNDAVAAPATFAPLLSGNISSTLVNSLLGKNNFVRVQELASVSFQGFSVAALGDAQGAIRLSNPNSPTGTLGVQTTYGGQVGYGDVLFKFAKGKGEVRLGGAAKYLFRAGGYHEPTITDLLTLNTANFLGDYKTFGSGFGVDTGTQVVYFLSNQITLKAGLAIADVGNTAFTSGVAAQSSNISAGLGVVYKNRDVVATLAYDYKHLADNIDWQKKTHIGLQLKLPIFTLSGGFSELYPTYGLGIDLWALQIQYTNYSEELANVVGINPESRNMLNAKVDFTF